MSNTTTSNIDSSAERRLKKRSGEIMNGLRYTFKTHYKMAEAYEKSAKISDSIVAAGTAILAILLTWQEFTQEILITIAIVIAITSWSQAVLKLGSKSQKHYNAGDRYHTLFERFNTFVKTEIPDEDISLEEKKEKFQQLTRERDQLNELSPRTTNFWYNRLSEEDIRATAGSDEEEVNRLAGLEIPE